MRNYILATLVLMTALALPLESHGQKKGKDRPKPVVVATVGRHDQSPSFKGNGLLSPREKALLSVDVAGRVSVVHKRIGDYVNKGELLAELVNLDLQLNLRVLQARLREAEAGLTLARQKAERTRALFRQKLASKEQHDEESAKLEVTLAGTAGVKAQVERLERQLEQMFVLAPISGQIIRTELEIGQWITPNKPIYEIFDYSRFELMVGLPGRYLNKIPQGARVVITVPEIGEERVGRIEAVVRHVDQASGNFFLRIEMDNPGGTPMSGLLARVEVPVGKAASVMIVPRDAVVRKKGKTLVIAVREGKAEVVPVSVGGSVGGGNVIVEGGLKAGELVVVRGNERLFPGTPVKITGKL